MAGHLLRCFVLSLLLGVILQSAVCKAYDFNSTDGLSTHVSNDGRHAVLINNTVWLNSAKTFFFIDGTRYSSDGSLNLTSTSSGDGRDVLGKFQYVAMVWKPYTKTGQKEIKTVVKTYSDLPLIVYEQNFPDTLEGTNIGFPDGVCTAFPAFKVEGQKGDRGYMSYGGLFLRDTKLGMFADGTTEINFGLYGGPLAIFDKTLNTMVISPFAEFMVGSVQLLDGVLNYGLIGSIDHIPASFRFRTAVYYGKGINEAILGFGDALMTKYGKQKHLMKSDFTVNYLGYWTDNGAYYYYNTEPDKNYEDTLIDVKNYADSLSIPYRYMQIDSWWYYKGLNGGVKNWTARPDIFPNGLQYLSKKTQLPIAAHNRWWTYTAVYAKVNGGKYNFIVERDDGHSIPQDAEFWDYLLATSREWQLIMYEQDWLNHEFEHMHATLQNVSVARDWLLQMGSGASKNDMTVQYCMPMPRHVLQSVEIPSVTQIRASDDYQPGNDQWKIGISSILHYALGLAPFKDTFWTVPAQTGNPRYKHKTEPYVELQSVVTSLSTGPVGPSDKIGFTNTSLLMRCCNTDGLILKSSKPVTAIDLQLKQAAFGSGGPDGEVWSTYSDIAGYRFGTLLWVNVKTPYPITPQQAGFGKLYSSYAFSDRDPVKTLVKFDEENPLNQHKCGKADFGLWHSVSEIKFGSKTVLILGELSKWVKMSPQRVLDITIFPGDVVLTLQGGVNEVIEFTVVYTDDLTSPHQIKCTVPESGRVLMQLSTEECDIY
ncbi:uncharacterized protein [Ptychodera flava]|uniref:uncharacterized protein n=1 Tax=Ptychodera flava TaxID=63121 RepID=UPI00396A9EA3